MLQLSISNTHIRTLNFEISKYKFSTIMEIHSVFKIMFQTRLWPLRVDREGNHRLNLLDIPLILFFIVYIAALCVYYWVIFPAFQDVGNINKFVHYSQIILFIYPTVQPFFNVPIGYSLSHLSCALCDSKGTVGWKSIIYVTITIIFLHLSTIIQQELL